MRGTRVVLVALPLEVRKTIPFNKLFLHLFGVESRTSILCLHAITVYTLHIHWTLYTKLYYMVRLELFEDISPNPGMYSSLNSHFLYAVLSIIYNHSFGSRRRNNTFGRAQFKIRYLSTAL